MNYTTALQTLAGRDRLKLENNTYLEKRDDAIAVKLHNTDVLTFLPNGRTRYNSGGWKTVTTKDRMNQYGPARIHQKDSEWILNGNFVYTDGIEVKENGEPFQGRHVTGKDKKSLNGKKAKIKKYVDGYIKALLDGKVPAPSGSDCWGCLMKADDGTRPLGRDCVALHIEDAYYVPSLLVRAFEKYPVGAIIQGCVGTLWQGKTLEPYAQMLIRTFAGRSLTRLLKSLLGLVA